IHQNITKPSAFLWVPVIILSSFTLLFGLFPMLADEGILKFAFDVVRKTPTELYLKIWHGFNEVLLLSALTIVIGFAMFLAKKYNGKPLEFLEKFNRISPRNIVENFGEATRNFAFQYTRFFHNGYLRNYLLTIII